MPRQQRFRSCGKILWRQLSANTIYANTDQNYTLRCKYCNGFLITEDAATSVAAVINGWCIECSNCLYRLSIADGHFAYASMYNSQIAAAEAYEGEISVYDPEKWTWIHLYEIDMENATVDYVLNVLKFEARRVQLKNAVTLS